MQSPRVEILPGDLITEAEEPTMKVTKNLRHSAPFLKEHSTE